MKELGVRFLLVGFSEAAGNRTFAFEGVAPDWTRQSLSVGVNMGLAQRCGIRLQDLPLLCRSVLERAFAVTGHELGEEGFVLSEEEMRTHVLASAPSAAGRPRKAPRPQSNRAGLGSAWRGNPGVRTLADGSS